MFFKNLYNQNNFNKLEKFIELYSKKIMQIKELN